MHGSAYMPENNERTLGMKTSAHALCEHLRMLHFVYHWPSFSLKSYSINIVKPCMINKILRNLKDQKLISSTFKALKFKGFLDVYN